MCYFLSKTLLFSILDTNFTKTFPFLLLCNIDFYSQMRKNFFLIFFFTPKGFFFFSKRHEKFSQLKFWWWMPEETFFRELRKIFCLWMVIGGTTFPVCWIHKNNLYSSKALVQVRTKWIFNGVFPFRNFDKKEIEGKIFFSY